MTELVPERLRPGLRLAGRYRLEAILGTGGMAIVWRAQDERLGRPVAIKVMSDALAADPAYVARFAREAQTASQILHPSVVEIYDYSAGPPRPYLVMEFVAGGTLAARLKSGPLTGDAAGALAHDLLTALSVVHRHGILHRDVKPANVLLDPGGRARLTDFGIAQLEDSTRLTLPGQLVGTLRYLAPELTRGGEPSPQSDLYALGVLLGEATRESTDHELGELIAWLTAEDPADRPASADVVLLGAGDTEPVRPPTEPGSSTRDRRAATASTPPPFTVHRARRPRLLAAVAALAVVAVVAVVAVIALSSGGSAGSPPPTTSGTTAGSPAPAARLTLQQRLSRLQQAIPPASSG